MRAVRRLTVALAIVAVSLAPPPAAADDLGDDLADVEAQIEELLADIDGASADRTDTVAQITAIQQVLTELRGDLAAGEQALEDATWQRNLERVKLDSERDALAAAEAEFEAARVAVENGKIAARDAVRRLYMGSGAETPTVVLTAESITTASLSVDYLERIARHTGAAVVEYEGLAAAAARHESLVAAREAALVEQIGFLDFIEQQRASYAETVAAQTALVAEQLDAQRALLADVDRDLAFFEGELASLEAEQTQIEALIAAETTPSSGEATVAGAYVRPVPGAITSAFGPRFHPILGYTRMHSGVDMTAAYGQAIRAMAGGRVILAGTHGGYGNTVIIDHGAGLTTLYAHQSSFNASYGDSVEAGDIVGYAGSSGLATGPHLHFEVRMNGIPVDPAPYLAGT